MDFAKELIRKSDKVTLSEVLLTFVADGTISPSALESAFEKSRFKLQEQDAHAFAVAIARQKRQPDCTAVDIPEARNVLCLSATELRIVSSFLSDGTILLGSWCPHPEANSSAVFSADGKTVLTMSCNSGQSVRKVWDLSGQYILESNARSGPLSTFDVSPQAALEDHFSPVESGVLPRGLRRMRFSPDGKRAALVMCFSKVVNLSIVPEAQRRPSPKDFIRAHKMPCPADRTPWPVQHTLNGHSGEIFDARWSPNGNFVVTASHDTTLKVYDSATGELQHSLEGHSDRISSCAISPCGTRILR
jgi:WD40 repeat protein